MKQTKRRLLSLLMAFAILCTMIPAAFAAETIEWKEGTWTNEGITDEHKEHTAAANPVITEPTCTTSGTRVYTCTYEGCTDTRTDTAPALGHAIDESKWEHDETYHWHKCTRERCEYTTEKIKHDFTLENGTKCGVCGATRTLEIKLDVIKTPASGTVTVNLGETMTFQARATATYGDETLTVNYAWTLDGQPVTATGDKYTLPSTTEYGNHTVACTVSASKDGKTKSEKVEWTVKVEQNVLSLSKDSITLNGRNDYEDLSATVSGGEQSASDVTWSVKPTGYVELKDYKDGSVRITPLKNGTVTVYASLKVLGYTYTVACEVTVKGLNTDIVVKSTIFNTNSGYDFDEKDDEGGTSVVDQIWDEIHDFTKGDYDLKYVEFSSPLSYSGKGELSARTGKSYYYNPSSSQEDLADVTFTPAKDYKGDVSFDFTAYDDGGYTYSGTITFEVKAGATSAGDIIYTAIKDKNVALDVKDFEEFWEDEYSKGTLDYVSFGSVSSSRGALLDGDGNKLKTSSKCYADPSSKQIDLDEVTFEPKSGFTGTVTIDFTAYGTNNSKKNTELNGTLVIAYTKGEPKAITYSVTDKPVTLDGDDFLANYKDTMGTSAKTLQIKFLDVPSNGTLYYKYNEKTEKGTELTKKNIGTYTFSTNSKASKSLSDVTYVPDSKGRSDTVKFACYDSDNKLCYYGEVTFGATVKDVTVSLSSTSAGVTFNSADFFGASEDMLAVTYLTFGTPSNGTLYKDWTGINGTRVSSSDKFSYVASVTGYTSIGTVTYVPTAGYSGTVTIPFSAYTANGTVINGTVSIKVTATSTVTFTDVPTTGPQSWAYPYITRLASAGVVGGITPTTYGPKQQVKWGEVLKMVLLGAGHPAQTEGTGANWAANYLTYAYQKGIVSSDKIDLSKPITRVEMAELAAKALGLQPETSIKTGIVGPTDTTNGYVYALYNRGIVGGDSSSGKNLYNPNSTLLRDEMAKIVCGVMDNAK